MNIEVMRKLLVSSNKEDNLLALNVIRARNPDNRKVFSRELKEMCYGYFYRDSKGSRSYSDEQGYYQSHLYTKYFSPFTNQLWPSWEDLID